MAKTQTDSITQKVTAYSGLTDINKLPAEVIDQTKKIIFDELACAYVGRELVSGKLIADFVKRFGASPDVTVLGTKERAPVALAALANGTAGHANEIDGAHITDGHPGAVTVHACLAVAEKMNATGGALINAVVLGYDIGTRIVEANGGAFALRKNHSVHSDHLHAFGAAIACGRLLGLDNERLAYAAALAAGHAGGLAIVFEERRHITKALSTGQAAFAGATAAEMAAMGFEGHDALFDSGYGPLTWNTSGVRADIFDDLGIEYAVTGANFKFYSAGYPIHAPAEAAIDISATENLTYGDVDRIDVYTSTANVDVVSNREMPSICLEHMVALAFINRSLSFEVAHSTNAMEAAEVFELRRRIFSHADPQFDNQKPRSRGARVVVTARNGAIYERFVRYPRGYALRGPVDWEDLREKWDDMLCRRMGADRYRSFYDLIQKLDRCDDVSAVAWLMGHIANAHP